jgi:hypothetical protein
MPFDTFRLINLQQRGNHAHSLVLFKSRAIKTNPEQIAIFECNGQLTQTEIRVTHTHPPPKEYTDSDSDDDSDEYSDDETGTLYDVTQNYFAPVSPKTCMNYGNDKYNPGYCGIFGIIAMVFHRGFRGGIRPPTTVGDITVKMDLRSKSTERFRGGSAGVPPPNDGRRHHRKNGPSVEIDGGGLWRGVPRGFRPPTIDAPLNSPRMQGTVGDIPVKMDLRSKSTAAECDTPTPTDRKIYTRWIRDWTYILNYMLSPIPDEPDSHGCMGTELAAKVQEIIAAHPSTQTGFENAEKEINKELKRILRKK